MMMWGLGLLSLGLLLVIYGQWLFGIILLVLGITLFLKGKKETKDDGNDQDA